MSESITISLDRFHEIFNLVQRIERDYKTISECRLKTDGLSIDRNRWAMDNMGVNIQYMLNYLKGNPLKKWIHPRSTLIPQRLSKTPYFLASLGILKRPPTKP